MREWSSLPLEFYNLLKCSAFDGLLDMVWRINNHGGVYKKGAVFPMQKRYQTATSYLQTDSCGAAAAED